MNNKQIVGLRLWPDPILKRKTTVVDQFDTDLNTTVITMMKIMTTMEGAGLAAPQVGLLKRIVVWKIHDEEGFWINPEITQKSVEVALLEEGCLSFPGILLPVDRHINVIVKYQDTDGITHERICEGQLAQMAQHEIEHLDGIVFTKDLSRLKKDMINRRMTKFTKKVMRIRKNYEQQLGRPNVQQISSTPLEGNSEEQYDFSIEAESI